jgi:hypothetical protein
MGLMSGLLRPATAAEQGATYSGDASALEELPRLFRFGPEADA